MTRTNTNLYVETGAAGAGASFPTGVCFPERDPSLHDYTIRFQCRGSKLQHQGIPSDCHHRLRSGTAAGLERKTRHQFWVSTDWGCSRMKG